MAQNVTLELILDALCEMAHPLPPPPKDTKDLSGERV